MFVLYEIVMQIVGILLAVVFIYWVFPGFEMSWYKFLTLNAGIAGFRLADHLFHRFNYVHKKSDTDQRQEPEDESKGTVSGFWPTINEPLDEEDWTFNNRRK